MSVPVTCLICDVDTGFIVSSTRRRRCPYCDAAFCSKCLESWQNQSQLHYVGMRLTCPMCRKKIPLYPDQDCDEKSSCCQVCDIEFSRENGILCDDNSNHKIDSMCDHQFCISCLKQSNKWLNAGFYDNDQILCPICEVDISELVRTYDDESTTSSYIDEDQSATQSDIETKS